MRQPVHTQGRRKLQLADCRGAPCKIGPDNKLELEAVLFEITLKSAGLYVHIYINIPQKNIFLY